MARKVNQVLWDQWQQRMERQRTSGLSIVEFCRREHVSPHRFHVWKRKMHPTIATRHGSGKAARKQRSGKSRSMVIPRPRRRQALSNPLLAPRPAEFLQLPVTAGQGSPWMELALADGTILRLPQQNLAALVTALRVLRGERVERLPGAPGHA
jgi:hypothetical protein